MFERNPTHLVLAAAIALGVTSLALAQNDRGDDRNPNRDQNQDKQEQRDANRERRDERELAGSMTKATDLMGMRVDDKEGNRIGDIRNLAINAEHGHIRYVIVDNGKGTFYPVPMQAIRYENNQKRAIVSTTAERMKNAPPFDPKGWNTIGDAKWGKIVYEFYGVNRTPDEEKERPEFIPAGQVIAAAVESPRGDSLGTIKDLAIDTDKRVVTYAVLEFGNNRLFATPWEALNFKDGGKQVILRGVERDDLKDAPGFPNGRWPAAKDLGWKSDTNFDSPPPNWLYGLKESQGSRGENDGRDANNRGDRSNQPDEGERGVMGGWQTNSAYGKLFKRNAIERIDGTVVRTEKVTPMQGMDPGVAIIVKGEGERNMLVHLGPEWFVRHQQDTFKDGERVQVSGSKVDIDGKTLIMATQLRLGGRTMTLRDEDGTPAWDAWQERKR